MFAFRLNAEDYVVELDIVVLQYPPVRRLLDDERAEASVNCLANWSLSTHQISMQSVQSFPRYGKGARTCARADVPHPWFV